MSGRLRASPHFYNTMDEVERVVSLLEKAAAALKKLGYSANTLEQSELDEAAALVSPLRLFDGAAAGVGDELALDAALGVVVVAGMVAAGVAHGDEAVEGVVLVPHGAAVRAASPHDAAEVVAELANGGRGGRILGARRGFSACGVDEAVGVDGVLQAPARVVAPVAPAAGVVADRGESALRVVAQVFGLLEARAAPAAFERPSFGVVAEGVEHAEVEGRARRDVEQLGVFLLALDLGVRPAQRVFEIVADVLVELLVLLVGDVRLAAHPQGVGLVDGLVLVGDDLLLLLVVFAVGSLLGGLSTSTGTLLAARALQGLGGALLVPSSLAIIGASFPDEERGSVVRAIVVLRDGIELAPIYYVAYGEEVLAAMGYDTFYSRIGIGQSSHFDLFGAFPVALRDLGDAAISIYRTLWLLISGSQVKLSQMSGFIGIYTITANAASQGLISLLNWVGLLSVNLGIVNLLPIPVLDGGQLVFLLYEGVRGKPPSMAARMRLTQIGFFIILLITDILGLTKIFPFTRSVR